MSRSRVATLPGTTAPAGGALEKQGPAGKLSVPAGADRKGIAEPSPTLPGTTAAAGVGALEKQGAGLAAGADRKATDAGKENATINGGTPPKPLNAPPPTPSKPVAVVPPQKAAAPNAPPHSATPPTPHPVAAATRSAAKPAPPAHKDHPDKKPPE